MTQLYFNDFFFGKKLGKGSFGTVNKCRNMYTNEFYAIKTIRDEDRFRKAAIKEIEVLNYLMDIKNGLKDNHFPIINFYKDFKINNIQYLVFELESINLYDYYYKNYFCINMNFIRIIAKQLCQGLQYIHTKFIHNDLKPENIMLNLTTKNVKIIDFGSALDKYKHRTFFYHQSRYYRAPEVLFNLQFNEKIDIWSLGCILGELICNYPLFNGKNERDLIFKMTEKLDIPKDYIYINSIKFNNYFTKLKEDLGEKKEEYEYFRIKEGITLQRNYKPMNYCLDKYINKYLQFFRAEEKDKKNLIDLISKMLLYNYHFRLSAEECLLHPLFVI